MTITRYLRDIHGVVHIKNPQGHGSDRLCRTVPFVHPIPDLESVEVFIVDGPSCLWCIARRRYLSGDLISEAAIRASVGSDTSHEDDHETKPS